MCVGLVSGRRSTSGKNPCRSTYQPGVLGHTMTDLHVSNPKETHGVAAAQGVPVLVTTVELAAVLRVHPSTVRRWVRAGAPVLRLPGALRFDLEAVRLWLDTGRDEHDVR